MKNKIIVLVMALMIVGLMTGSAAASDWEAIGGIQIVNVTLDTYNDTIDTFNDAVSALNANPDLLIAKYKNEGYNISTTQENQLKSLISDTDVTNIDEYDNIDRVPLIYLGAKKKINDKMDLNIRYEYIFGEVEQSYTATSLSRKITTSYNNFIEVDLHGLTLLLDYELNENWYATGGIGYHQGTKTTDLNGPAYKLIQGLKPTVETGENEYDLDNGISLRAGVGYKRGFAENWDFNAQLDYLYIELDDEQQGNIYSKGFSYGLGLTYSF